ncbi:esterase/lipase family protein [Massilia rhizosphaerae]|uniref:esterase/lipase family protein n=1 Tax=Massilia rhizosphaerae TaxID=2784389 RepID=UPI0018DCF2E9|nr:hypothetical protein [Massilia rhizosphaerae]
MTKKAIIFVHGLGGSEKTWGLFDELLESDQSVDWDVSHFVYPTPPLGFRVVAFFQSNYQPIEVLAQALKNQIDIRFQDFDEIALVGHSLGGLIIRQYLMNERIAQRTTKITKIVLYATPNTGADLARIGKALSFGENGHTRQLCKNSDFLNILNRNWASSGIESTVDITVIVGGNDRIVPRESVEANFRTQDREPLVILEAGHRDIAKPKSVDDDRYVFLVSSLKKKLRLTQLKTLGGMPLGEWARYAHLNTLPFHLDAKRGLQIEEVLKHFGQHQKTLRVTGLSGLGKTRLVFEASRRLDTDRADQVIYFDAAPESINLVGWLRDAIRKGAEGTLIVDNCSVDLHEKLQLEVGRVDSSVCLITVDYSPERIQGIPMIRLERLPDEDIAAMLAPVYRDKIDDLELQKIVAFAQGFPQMAVLLANARLNDDPELGILTDDQIASKLLWGNETPSLEHERILQACALFETFGVDSGVSDQFSFIAEKVLGFEEDIVYQCIQDFTERGLIDRRGRFAQLVPKPLAVRLAAKWWKRAQRAQQLRLIEELPSAMEGSFCAQIARMDTLPEVKELTAALCGPQGPFGRAEVIFSRKGSMLFRALVEVNPDATAEMIQRVITAATDEALLNIRGDARRNLVWGLEKLSVRRQTFAEAAYCLLRLASNENETWSNNATGQFRQLFRLQLSGVQAPPADRFAFLRSILTMKEEKLTSLVLQALSAGLDLNGGFRTVGAEYQGINSRIDEWQPASWEDVASYLDECLRILREVMNEGDCNIEDIKSIVGPKIRQLVGLNQAANLDKILAEIVTHDGPFWPQALDSIISALEYDREQLKADDVRFLELWMQRLGGKSGTLEDRLKILVIEPPFDHRERDGEFIDVAAENASEFAREIAQTPASIKIATDLLLQANTHRQTFNFGHALALEVQDPSQLAKDVWIEAAKLPQPSTRFLLGIMSGISKKDPTLWRQLIDEFCQNGRGVDLLMPDVLTTGHIVDSDLTRLQQLAECGAIELERLRILAYGSVLGDLEPDTVSAFALSLIDVDEGEINAWISLDILFMYCYGNQSRRVACRDTFRAICLRCAFGSRAHRKDLHQWEKTCEWLCVGDSAFRTALAEKICNTVGDTTVSHDEIADFHSVTRAALNNVQWSEDNISGEKTWSVLAQSIVSSDGLAYLHFMWMFEARQRMSDLKRGSLIECIPAPTLLKWCDEHPETAPFFVARTIQVLVELDGALALNPILIALLARFGHTDDLGSEIASNLFTRSWSGSLVPIIEREREAISKLATHENANVRRWANNYTAELTERISVEMRRDDERNFGIY